MNLKQIIVGVAMVSSIVSQAGGFFPIVENHQAKTTIVLPEKANRTEEYAAKELQAHLQKSTGAALPIIPETEVPANAMAIYLGATEFSRKNNADASALKPNDYYKSITSDYVILAGKDGDASLPEDDATPVGTLFAVYDLLENDLGVRWMWPGDNGTFIPKKDSVFLAPDTKMVKYPFWHTRWRADSPYWDYKGIVDEAYVKKAYHERQVWLRRHRFTRPVSLEYGHAFELFWKRFGANGEHPDYFAMRSDGKRTPWDKNDSLVQMCVSNPKLHTQIAQDWIDGKQSFPGDFINGAENDKREVDEFCHCPNCKAWDPAGVKYMPPPKTDKNGWPIENFTTYGQMKNNNFLADRYSKFWLAIQAEAKRLTNKDVIVLGYAYSDISEPPKNTKLNENILLGFVPDGDYPLEPARRDLYINQWMGWRKAGARLYLRSNSTLVGYTYPLLYGRQFAEDFKFAYKNGMVGNDYDSLTSMFSTQGPTLYLIARLNANPELEIDDVLGEYYQCFGKAAPKIKEYFDFFEKISLERTMDFMVKQNIAGWNGMGHYGNKLFTLPRLAQAQKILDEAKSLAADDADAQERLSFLQIGLTHTVLTTETMNAFDASNADKGNQKLRQEFEASLAKLDQFRKQMPDPHAINIVMVNKLEMWSGWRAKNYEE